MAIHEECGVFGVMSTKRENVASIAYYGLYALQHRGQESCGIVVNDDGVFSSYKDLGLVSEVFSKDALAHLSAGNMAVGHVRYGTTGGTTRNNCQPIEVNHQKGKMALAHNGNLSNALELRDKLELSGAIFHTTSDTETIAYVVTRERLVTPSIEEAASKAMNSLEGAYSLILMSSTKMIAARDPYGFRPLCYGQMPDGAYGEDIGILRFGLPCQTAACRDLPRDGDQTAGQVLLRAELLCRHGMGGGTEGDDEGGLLLSHGFTSRSAPFIFSTMVYILVT